MVTGREGEDGKYVRRHQDSIIAELVNTETCANREDRLPTPPPRVTSTLNAFLIK